MQNGSFYNNEFHYSIASYLCMNVYIMLQLIKVGLILINFVASKYAPWDR